MQVRRVPSKQAPPCRHAECVQRETHCEAEQAQGSPESHRPRETLRVQSTLNPGQQCSMGVAGQSTPHSDRLLKLQTAFLSQSDFSAIV